MISGDQFMVKRMPIPTLPESNSKPNIDIVLYEEGTLVTTQSKR